MELTLRALANSNRLKLLKECKRGKSFSVSGAAAFLHITPSAASRHLQSLENAGILKSTKRGLFVTYRLSLAGIPQWVKAMLREL